MESVFPVWRLKCPFRPKFQSPLLRPDLSSFWSFLRSIEEAHLCSHLKFASSFQKWLCGRQDVSSGRNEQLLESLFRRESSRRKNGGPTVWRATRKTDIYWRSGSRFKIFGFSILLLKRFNFLEIYHKILNLILDFRTSFNSAALLSLRFGGEEKQKKVE